MIDCTVAAAATRYSTSSERSASCCTPAHSQRLCSSAYGVLQICLWYDMWI